MTENLKSCIPGILEELHQGTDRAESILELMKLSQSYLKTALIANSPTKSKHAVEQSTANLRDAITLYGACVNRIRSATEILEKADIEDEEMKE